MQAGRVSLTVAARLGADLQLLAAAIPTDWYQASADVLIEHAAAGASTSTLASVREVLIDQYGPDEAFEDQQKTVHRLRGFTRPVKNAAGQWVGRYALDNDAHAILTAAFDALAAPCPAADGEADDRTGDQRRLDAIIEMAGVVASDPTLLEHARPVSASRAQVVVTIGLEALRSELTSRGYGVDGHGNPLTAATVRRMCCHAGITPAVLDSDSAILDLGRAARLASPDQLRYLGLRDRGCVYPGCDRPPSWCEAHHLDEWDADGGPTDVDNLALLCTRHHTVVHHRKLKGHLVDGTVRWRPRTPARQ